MAQPPHPSRAPLTAPIAAGRPGVPPAALAPPKKATIVVVRADDGLATYSLLIDDVPQKLSANSAHWDDASPWAAGVYNGTYSPLHGRTAAFLLSPVANRSAIKFHMGSVTAHSEGCIVTPLPHVQEIIDTLHARHFPLDQVKFDIRGNYDIGYRLGLAGPPGPVAPGSRFDLVLWLTGGGATHGVSKDICFYIVSDTLTYERDYTLRVGEPMPVYRTDTSYPFRPGGFWVRLAATQPQKTFELILRPAHAATAANKAVFKILMYKIVNNAVGIPPYFYTPSDYSLVLAAATETEPLQIAPAARAAPGFHPGVPAAVTLGQ